MQVVGAEEEGKKKEGGAAGEFKNPTLKIKVHLPENAKDPAVRDTIRAHIFARQFLPNNCNNTVNAMRKIRKAPLVSSTTFGLKKTVYLNN